MMRKRCAIYTRKSTEDGLDQEFNSLDAQSESCGAYILSQAGEGWKKVDKTYSDGGISGGHMDRPGLKALISDIEAGRIDIIVVYKVDRLTRSLADFAKLVEVFDAHEVSFVSITQAFNTTTSMGRLTLNVLLSFAQFEREVTAERIRDKIAASKARGKWMGGLVPMGYDSVDTKLVINEPESKVIRTIFELYIKLGSVPALKLELDKQGIKTKRRVTKRNQQTGGRPFSRGHLYKLLGNPIYIGKVRHKDKIYDGEHEGLIETALWDTVQTKLKDNAPKRTCGINLDSGSLLTGLIYDGTGDRLTPIHTKKSGRRYRYYVSRRLTLGETDDGSGWRLPAKRFERHVTQKLTALLENPTILLEKLSIKDIDHTTLKSITKAANAMLAQINNVNPKTQREALIKLVSKITIDKDTLTLELNPEELLPDIETEEAVRLEYSLTQKRRGVETRLIIGGTPLNTPDAKLLGTIAKARDWHRKLQDGSYKSLLEIAANEKIDRAEVSRSLPLAFLAPSILRDMMKGHQPVDLTLDALRRKSSGLPLCWNAQRQYLGFGA